MVTFRAHLDNPGSSPHLKVSWLAALVPSAPLMPHGKHVRWWVPTFQELWHGHFWGAIMLPLHETDRQNETVVQIVRKKASSSMERVLCTVALKSETWVILWPHPPAHPWISISQLTSRSLSIFIYQVGLKITTSQKRCRNKIFFKIKEAVLGQK